MFNYQNYGVVNEIPPKAGFVAIPAFSFLGLVVFAMIILWPY